MSRPRSTTVKDVASGINCLFGVGCAHCRCKLALNDPEVLQGFLRVDPHFRINVEHAHSWNGFVLEKSSAFKQSRCASVLAFN